MNLYNLIGCLICASCSQLRELVLWNGDSSLFLVNGVNGEVVQTWPSPMRLTPELAKWHAEAWLQLRQNRLAPAVAV